MFVVITRNTPSNKVKAKGEDCSKRSKTKKKKRKEMGKRKLWVFLG